MCVRYTQSFCKSLLQPILYISVDEACGRKCKKLYSIYCPRIFLLQQSLFLLHSKQIKTKKNSKKCPELLNLVKHKIKCMRQTYAGMEVWGRVHCLTSWGALTSHGHLGMAQPEGEFHESHHGSNRWCWIFNREIFFKL